MAATNPSGPQQPTAEQAYEAPQNAATREPAEEANARSNARAENTGETRGPSANAEPTPTASGKGSSKGAGAGEEARGATQEDVGQHKELDGEQMSAPGEGDVSAAVKNTGRKGPGGEQDDFAADLDRKKRQQAPLREAIQSKKQEKVDVQGVLANRGGPANPVD